MNRKIVIPIFAFLVMLAMVSSAFAVDCSGPELCPPPKEIRFKVTVILCGTVHRGYLKTFCFECRPTSVIMQISSGAFKEILQFWGTDTFCAPFSDVKYVQVRYGRGKYYTASHSLSIGVQGLDSITVILKTR